MKARPLIFAIRCCATFLVVVGISGASIFGQVTSSVSSAQVQTDTELNEGNNLERSSVVSAKEQKVKAAYIYNFSRYFEWPAKVFDDTSKPFVIGVLGADPLGNQLDRLAAKKTVRKRKIEIHRFNSIDQYKDCQMLFVTRSVSEEQFQLALARANVEHVLVVSERPPDTRHGSSVQIFIDHTGKVGFEIDVDVVSARKIHVSAKLLKLANVSGHKK